MNPQMQTRCESLAKVFKALAHPTRLFIVEELGKNGPRCVCELTSMVGADMSTVSKHLTVLKQAGIVADEKRGSMVFYQLQVECVLGFFECVERVLMRNAAAQLESLRPVEVASPAPQACT